MFKYDLKKHIDQSSSFPYYIQVNVKKKKEKREKTNKNDKNKIITEQ